MHHPDPITLLYLQHAEEIRRRIRRQYPRIDAALVEDAVQEGFTRYLGWKKGPERERHPEETLLILTSMASRGLNENLGRKGERMTCYPGHEVLDLYLGVWEDSPDLGLDLSRHYLACLRLAARECGGRHPDRMSGALRFRLEREVSDEEAARACGVPRSRLCQGRRVLAQRLTQRGLAPSGAFPREGRRGSCRACARAAVVHKHQKG